MKKFSVALAGLALLASVSGAKEFINIGTGGMTGTYYPVGGAICRLVNMDKNMKCSVQSTGGSTYNVNNVLKKELNFSLMPEPSKANRSSSSWTDSHAPSPKPSLGMPLPTWIFRKSAVDRKSVV